MHDKLNILDTMSQQLGLKIHRGKTKEMKVNQANNPICLGEASLQKVDFCTCLSSNIDNNEGTGRD